MFKQFETEEEYQSHIDELLNSKKTEINYTQASELIRKQGGKVFPDEDSYKSSIKATIGNFDRDNRKVLKELTGVDWNEGEIFPDYSKRAMEEYKTKLSGQGNDATLEEYKTKLKEREQLLEQLNGKVQEYETKAWESQKETWLNKAIEGKNFFVPDGLAEEEAKSFVNFQKQSYLTKVNERFSFDKDDKGTPYVKDLSTGDISTEIPKMINAKIEELGVKFAEKTKKPTLPSGGDKSGSPQDGEAFKVALNNAKQEIFKAGKYGHEFADENVISIYKKHGVWDSKNNRIKSL